MPRDEDVAAGYGGYGGGGFGGNPRGEPSGFSGGGWNAVTGGGGDQPGFNIPSQFSQLPPPPPPIPDFQFMGQPPSFMPQIAPQSFMAPPMNLQQLYQMYGVGPQGQPQQSTTPQRSGPTPGGMFPQSNSALFGGFPSAHNVGDWFLNRRF